MSHQLPTFSSVTFPFQLASAFLILVHWLRPFSHYLLYTPCIVLLHSRGFRILHFLSLAPHLPPPLMINISIVFELLVISAFILLCKYSGLLILMKYLFTERIRTRTMLQFSNGGTSDQYA